MNARHPLMLRGALLVVIAVLFAHGIVMHSQDAAPAGFREAFDSGLSALEQNRPDDAIAAFRRCLQLVPRHALSAYNLACAYSIRKDAAGALEWLARAADWGYENVDHIFEDADLTFLRSQQGFSRIIQDIQNRFPASAQRRRLPNDEADRGLELVAMVRSEIGSGAAILLGRESNRLILATANHVVRRGGTEARGLEVQVKTLAPRWEKALPLPAAADPELDLAFIAIDNIVGRDLNVCALPLHLSGDSSRLRRGDPVFPVGYPNGILWAMPLAADRVSQALPTQLSFESQFIRVGFSGGALLNQAGEVVGMITADEPPLGRAIPLATILQVARAAKHPVQLSTPGDRAGAPLHAAARQGDVATLRQMLENCADPNSVDAKGRTALHEAAVQGSADAVQALISAGAQPHPWTIVHEEQSAREWGTPLHLAAQYGHVLAVKALLGAGEDVDLQTLRRYEDRAMEPRNTALQMAARYDRAQVAEALLAAGASRDGPTDGFTPLRIAAASGSAGVAKVLVRHGAAAAARDKVGQSSPLHDAAQAGAAEIVQLLVEAGLDVNVKGSSNNTPLHVASEHGRVNVVQTLIALKADLDAQGYLANTPLHMAAEDGKSEVVKMLLANGADPNRLNERRIAPLVMATERMDVENIRALVNAKADVGYSLHTILNRAERCRWDQPPDSCQERHSVIARILLEGGADPELRDSDGRQPLHFAASSGLADIVTLLLKRGAPIATTDRGESAMPLHLAAEKGHSDVVRLLIASKAPVNQRDRSGRTALYRAVYEKHTPVVELLLLAGADPNIGSSYSNFDDMPVAKAASGPTDILALLLKAGADPNRGGVSVGYSPLHQAVSAGNLENVKLLLQAGARGAAQSNGWWPLHETVRHTLDANREKSVIPMIELLVAAGHPVDAADDNGATPLHLAAEEGSTAAVKALIAKGAPVDAIDKCGLTPLAYVLRDREMDAVAVAEVLLNAGASVNMTNSCSNRTLLEMVEAQGYVSLRQLLIAKGARTK